MVSCGIIGDTRWVFSSDKDEENFWRLAHARNVYVIIKLQCPGDDSDITKFQHNLEQYHYAIFIVRPVKILTSKKDEERTSDTCNLFEVFQIGFIENTMSEYCVNKLMKESYYAWLSKIPNHERKIMGHLMTKQYSKNRSILINILLYALTEIQVHRSEIKDADNICFEILSDLSVAMDLPKNNCYLFGEYIGECESRFSGCPYYFGFGNEYHPNLCGGDADCDTCWRRALGEDSAIERK